MLIPIPQGSRVGIISPSSGISSPEEIHSGLKYIQQSLGYNVVLGKYVFDNYYTLGGTPQQRAEDLMDFFKDQSIKAIFCTRGGYGSQAILPLLDYEIIKHNPKPIIGFSDITALQMGIYSQSGNISYAGPLLKFDYENGKPNPILEASLKKILSGKAEDIRGGLTVIPGQTQGIILGTNLAVLQHLAGTTYYPDFTDAILLLEDVDAATYIYESLLIQLKQQKGFSKIKGIIFGQFTDSFIRRSGQKDLNQIIEDFCQDLEIPVIKNFPFGHIAARSVIPLGVKVSLDAAECKLKF